jgi:putative transposase
MKTRRRFTAEFKAKVALEAIRGERTISELATKHQLHPNQITQWKRQAIENLAKEFDDKASDAQVGREAEVTKLPPRSASLSWSGILRGATGLPFDSQGLRSLSLDRRRMMIDPDHQRLSIRRQCELVSISRASFYRQPVGETPENLELMRIVDEAFMEMPWYGSRQMARHLRRQGWCVGRKRVRRLMRKIGLSPIYQAPKTSEPHPRHRIYPYLLRHLSIERPN